MPKTVKRKVDRTVGKNSLSIQPQGNPMMIGRSNIQWFLNNGLPESHDLKLIWYMSAPGLDAILDYCNDLKKNPLYNDLQGKNWSEQQVILKRNPDEAMQLLSLVVKSTSSVAFKNAFSLLKKYRKEEDLGEPHSEEETYDTDVPEMTLLTLQCLLMIRHHPLDPKDDPIGRDAYGNFTYTFPSDTNVHNKTLEIYEQIFQTMILTTEQAEEVWNTVYKFVAYRKVDQSGNLPPGPPGGYQP